MANPRLVVDISNDGSRSVTKPFANVDSGTGRVIGIKANFLGAWVVLRCVQVERLLRPLSVQADILHILVSTSESKDTTTYVFISRVMSTD